MTVTIMPSAPAGSVAAPPSKSMAHRALICAALAGGGSAVRGVAASQDMLATLNCLRVLGAEFSFENGDVAFRRGVEAFSPPAGAALPCRECGSTLRFFVPLCLLGGGLFTLTGSETLLARPLSVYENICKSQGLMFEKGENTLRVCGPLRPGAFELPGDVSSQFVSGLLFALPLLEGDSVIELRPPVESRAYIDMTMEALDSFGVTARWRDETTIDVPGGQVYRARDFSVEGDWSNAAPFLALGADVTGLKADSTQGDKICEAYFKALDAYPAEVDISGCPDLGPVLMAYAALRFGGKLTGTRRLKLKESDRGEAMRAELAKFGVAAEIEENRIAVGSGVSAPSGVLDGHNDHRIVMALSVLCAHTGGTIAGAEAVDKSFPGFFERLKTINVGVKIHGVDQ